MIHKKIIIIIIGLLLLDAGIYIMNDHTNHGVTAHHELDIVVTIPPQREFVKEVGGDKVKVTLMVPPGEDPHSYEPETSQMRELAEADIYYKIGSGLEFEETWMDTMKDYNPEMDVIDGSKGIELLTIGEHEVNKNHDHHNIDPHIWLSPKKTIRMIENLVEGMVDIDPANSDFYQENAEVYKHELEELDSELKEGLYRYQGEEFLVYHPSFGYLAHDYNLIQVPVQEEGKEPGTKGLESIIDQAKRNNISVIFVSPQFDESNAETIAEEIDGEVGILNPLAEDYLDNMKKIKNKLISGFEKGDG